MALPLSSASTDRRDDVLRLLADAPEGLSDAVLADHLGGASAGVRPGTVNALCRRMVGEGLIERVGQRPIRNRATGTAPEPVASLPAPAEPEVAEPVAEEPVAEEPLAEELPPGEESVTEEPASEEPASEEPASEEPASEEPASEEPASEEPASEEAASEEPASAGARSPAPDGAALAEPARRPRHTTGTRKRARPVEPAASGRGEAPGPPRPVLVRDVAQAWSRTVNVQAALASWLTERGATIRTATDDGHGPARDLVARLDGDDVHVEITGWPPDGARTHPTTVAGDWFAAAEDAARARRRAHPHARIVIALPDTRRYRALRRHRADSLAGAGAEVWFVDPSGAVEAVPG